jgi:hypothetical protein
MNRGGGDIFYHMFVASQVLNSGYLPITDIYPMMHIWLSLLHNFFPYFIILTIVISIVFFYSYVLSLYILGKTILGTKNGGIFISIFGIPFMFSFLHYSYIPFLFAFLMIPLILYAYQKIKNNPEQKNPFYICVISLSLFIVFCHPMITVFLIIMFSVFAFNEQFFRESLRLLNNVALKIVTIVLITFSYWLIHFREYLEAIEAMTSALIGPSSEISIIEYQTTVITTSNASIWLVIERFIKIYGSVCFYFLISLFFILYIIYQYYQKKKIYKDDFIYSQQFCIGICIGLALITGYFVIFETIRAAMYGLVFATILCGLVFYRILFSAISEKRYIVISISVIMTLVCMLTIFAMYSSPWIGSPSGAQTYGDKSGNDWILDYRNAEMPIVKAENPNYKYARYYFQIKKSNISQNLKEYDYIIQSHFGYNTNRTIGDSFAELPENKVYMITTEIMKLTPDAVPSNRRDLINSFTEADFTRMKNDPTVNIIYSGNKFGVVSIDII